MIEVDSVTQSCGSDTSTLSYAHTCSGSNGLLVVGVTLKYASHITSTSATYNSVSMTKSVSRGNTTSQGNGTIIFTLKNPSTGSNTVAISTNAGEYIGSGAISLKGVDQTTPVEVTASDRNSSQNVTPTVSITTQSSNSLVIDCVAYTSPTITTGSGQTDRWKQDSCSYYGAGSSESKETAGAVTMDWTISNSNWWAISAIAVKEADIKTISVPTAKLVTNGLLPTIFSTTIESVIIPISRLVYKGLSPAISIFETLANIAVPTAKLVVKGLTHTITQTANIAVSLGKLVLKPLTMLYIDGWINSAKHTTTWTGDTKHKTTHTGETKHTTTWTEENKHKQGQ